jgi:hypothetical protein
LKVNWKDYCEEAMKTAVWRTHPERYVPADIQAYIWHGMQSEWGELMGVLAKEIRDEGGKPNITKRMLECGDICWMAAAAVVECVPEAIDWLTKTENLDRNIPYALEKLCDKYGVDYESALEANLRKLQSRQERGVIQGSGDNR